MFQQSAKTSQVVKYLSNVDPLANDSGSLLRSGMVGSHQGGADDSVRDGIELFDCGLNRGSLRRSSGTAGC